MAKSYDEKLVLFTWLTGCVLVCCRVTVKASLMLPYTDYSFILYEVAEGERVVIDCSTKQPVYHTALSFKHDQIPRFYLAPNGQKLVQEGQVFTINNITLLDEGIYYCSAQDKNLTEHLKKAAEILISSEPQVVDPMDDESEFFTTAGDTAAKKLTASRPYLYFKQKSPLRIDVKGHTPFELSVAAKGLQPIKMQWKKDDLELMIGSRYKTYDSGRRMTVDPPFTMEDSGIYSVSACNSKGCAFKSAQVLFYVIPNNTQIIQEETIDEVEGEGFLGNFIKDYGLLGIPIFLAIILIIAIACTTGKKESEKTSEKETKIEVIEKVHIHKERTAGAGGGRTASVWSWLSDSSGDEMPDYDKLKTRNKPEKHSQRSLSSHSGNASEHDQNSAHYNEFHYQTEAGGHYNTVSDHRLHGHYSSKGEIYDVREYGDNSRQRESHSSIDLGDQQQHDSSSHDLGHYVRKHSESKRYQNNGKRLSDTKDRRDSRKTESSNSGLYKTEGIVFSEVNLEDAIYASVPIQRGIQPMRARVLQNKEIAPVQAQANVVDINDGEDFGFYPDFFEFD